MTVIGWLSRGNEDVNPDLHGGSIKNILLVRANFRIGNAILALPAIAGFRKNFPDARIDYVGSPVSNLLFQNQPLDQHYVAPRRFPRVLWQYPGLIRRLRANQYDLAVDISCSSSSVGSFVVGLSGARIRAGLAGKWDHFFNLKIPRLRESNKYRKLKEFLTAMHLEQIDHVGSLEFSAAEKIEGLRKLESLCGGKSAKTVGVFVGGRKLRGKRWPLENFTKLINGLYQRGIGVVTFLGPEENDIGDLLRASLNPSIPVIFEPSVRKFSAIVSNLGLLICCDSGPMHLACAAGVRVLAIFQKVDVARWSPPPAAARTVYGADSVSAAAVLDAALEELSLADSTNESPTTGPRPLSPKADPSVLF
jgi:heptosyltransferase III